ncbi:hypothetical protein SIL08_05705 [Scandinavium sp. V105_16]|uniref:Uncharacterized protein n=1 Tax=Scandinavium lactucae TaxID=3095028 RepID=A0AAJ2S8N0_9ENTR|nr:MULTISPECIES: hypothetical protein [unclassified Scandinavium]MDX6019778.1 hypothetical protein [Scandinavium sp. V105_16]MDX6033245.1 hypothetical protein [Scandinavium sp. V105_12]
MNNINSVEEFLELINSDDPANRMRSGTESASLSVWLNIIEKYPEFKVWVARNRTVPKEVIGILCVDPDPIVRHAISIKYPLDIEVYSKLAEDKDESIRSSLAYNRGFPIFLLKKMAENDPSDFVKKNASEMYKKRTHKK